MLELRRLHKLTKQYMFQPNDAVGVKILKVYVHLDEKEKYKYRMILKGKKLYWILQCTKQIICLLLSILALVVISLNEFCNLNQNSILDNTFVVKSREKLTAWLMDTSSSKIELA